MNNEDIIECMACGSTIAKIAWQPMYHGYRGHCPECDSDWPES